MADALAGINWAAPWLAPYVKVGQVASASVAAGQSVDQALNAAPTGNASPVCFVPQSRLPAGEAYERYIFNSNCCPTRKGLHDFFNGLAWLHFPRTKRQLNRLHVDQMARTGIASERGPARDGLTVFDENASFLMAPDVLWDALAAKDWRRLFVDLRPLWQEARLVLFGHALLEKLVSPRKSITTHVWRAQTATQSIAELDQWMASDVSADKLAAKPFAHLPVLGVPGWWPANEELTFYDDLSVFRPAKSEPNLWDNPLRA